MTKVSGMAACGGMAVLMAASAGGQTSNPVNPIDRRTAAQLSEQSKTLMTKAKTDPTGMAGATLENYPGHFTMLTVRTKTGGAEVHRDFTDIFFVLDGEATVITGGTVVDGKETTPGETRGAKVEGGTETRMGKGDVIHIDAKVPHQILIAPGKTFTYYIVKVEVPKS